MTFIAIAPNVLINPDKISVIEKREVMGQIKVVVTMDNGQQHIVSYDFGDLYAKLIGAGVTANDQFFAG